MIVRQTTSDNPPADMTTSAITRQEPETESTGGTIPLQRRLRKLLWHMGARQLTLLFLVGLKVAGWIGRPWRRAQGERGEILLTGRFDSNNWILAFLAQISASKECSRVWMVSTNPVPALPKVTAIYPSKRLIGIVGVTQARLLVFLWAALRKRPHIVGGFHIMVNGIVAIIVGCLIGARSLYFCVGGPAEIRDGGIHSADSLFTAMETADAVVERRLLKIVAHADTVITMGTRAVRFFRDQGIGTNIQVVSGSIDSTRFQPATEPPLVDVIVTGRLVSVKRIDVFLWAIRHVMNEIPNVKAVVVGDGRLRESLQRMAVELGVDRNVSFTGYVSDAEVTTWLHKSRVFVLTSDSEGLSLSMTEAMMCGLPAVVSDVGDLADLVEDGVNGYLVPPRSPELFARRIIELLTDPQKLATSSLAARRSALRFGTEAAIQRWDNILANL